MQFTISYCNIDSSKKRTAMTQWFSDSLYYLENTDDAIYDSNRKSIYTELQPIAADVLANCRMQAGNFHPVRE